MKPQSKKNHFLTDFASSFLLTKVFWSASKQLPILCNTPILSWEAPGMHQITFMSNSQPFLAQFYI